MMVAAIPLISTKFRFELASTQRMPAFKYALQPSEVEAVTIAVGQTHTVSGLL